VAELDRFFTFLHKQGGSDLHRSSRAKPMIRLHGKMTSLNVETFSPEQLVLRSPPRRTTSQSSGGEASPADHAGAETPATGSKKRSAPMRPHGRLRGKVPLAMGAVFLALSFPFPGVNAPASAPEGSDKKMTFSADEATALMRIIRSRAAPKALPPERIPEKLLEPLERPLIVTVYGEGVPLQRTAVRPTLSESALEAGDELARFLAKIPKGDLMIRESRLQLDIVTSREPLAEKSRALLMGGIAPGVDGLACTSGGQTVYLAPLALLRHWRSIDTVKDAYVAQESAAPPAVFAAERLTTAGFVEETPGGRVLPLYRGNVPLAQPHAEQMIQALSHTGLWFLRTQQQDGSFLPIYYPGDEGTEKDYNLADHLRGVIAVTMLHQLTGDGRFAAAGARALHYLDDPKFLREERRDQLLWLPIQNNDEITGTALFLAALCHRAMVEPNPTADGRMTSLGEFLCLMVAPNGRLYSRLVNARRNSPPFIVRGAPYAETLIALSMLQRISPTEKRRQAADRLADLIVSFPSDIQIMADRRTMARVTEALVEYYKLTRSDKHAETAFKIIEGLSTFQVGAEKVPYADWTGGFVESNFSPDTFTTAAGACALYSTYEMSLLMRRPTQAFSAPTRGAALFLMSMQYRPENTFFLSHPEVILGAFRRSPEDLSAHTADAAEAVRALIGAATVTAETVRLEPTEEKPEKSAATH